MLALRSIRRADVRKNLARPFRCNPSTDVAAKAAFNSRCYSSKSSIYEDFDVFSGAGGGRVIINSYDSTGFSANGIKVDGSMICLGKMAFAWSPKSLEEVSPETLSIFRLLRPAPEILVLGCGRTISRIGTDVREFLKSNGIKIEVVDTRNAASTFNILNEEGRQVAAAMLPYGYSPQPETSGYSSQPQTSEFSSQPQTRGYSSQSKTYGYGSQPQTHVPFGARAYFGSASEGLRGRRGNFKHPWAGTYFRCGCHAAEEVPPGKAAPVSLLHPAQDVHQGVKEEQLSTRALLDADGIQGDDKAPPGAGVRFATLNVESSQSSDAYDNGYSTGVVMPVDHNSDSSAPKSGAQSAVLGILNGLVKTDDLASKLAPYEGKITFEEGTTVMKMLDDNRLCFNFYMWLKKQPNFSPDVYSLLTVLRCLVRGNKWEKLIRVSKDLFNLGYELDNAFYCRIIKEASLNRKIAVCEWWFGKMKERGCWPDTITYNTMIHAYALAGMLERAFATFEAMKEAGVDPDINTFCHLLNGCRSAGKPDEAYSVFRQIESLGLRPNLVSFSTLLDTLGKHGKAVEAGELFNEMLAANVKPDAQAYNILIHAYGSAGMMDQAAATFDKFQKEAGQDPDKIVFWTMLNLYAKAGLMKQALSVKKLMRMSKIPVDTTCYLNLIDGFKAMERWEDAVRAFKEMQRYKYPVDKQTYEKMMKIYSKAEQHVECERIFDQMMEKGFRNSEGAYEVMINTYRRTNNVTNATRIFELMKRNNCTPNRNVCNIMMHIYAKAGMLPASEKIAEEMGEMGVKPNADTFRTLIKAYSVSGRHTSAMDVYHVMQESGVKPDYELCEMVLQVLLKTQQVNRAEKFLKEMIGGGLHPNKRMVNAVLRAGGVVELSKPLAVPRKAVQR